MSLESCVEWTSVIPVRTTVMVSKTEARRVRMMEGTPVRRSSWIMVTIMMPTRSGYVVVTSRA